MAAEPADSPIQAATVVLTAQLAFEARVTALLNMLDAAIDGQDHCLTDGPTEACATRTTISVGADGAVDLFIWARDMSGSVRLLSAAVPPKSVPFMTARKLAEQYVEDRIAELVCPASGGEGSG